MPYERYRYEGVYRYSVDLFQHYGFSKEESKTITEVLLTADLFGIESHGIQRLIRYHHAMKDGMVRVGAVPEVVHETPVSAVIDAKAAMGQLVGTQAMKLAIQKAKTTGVGMVAVRHSNHYGIAGYYTLMAAGEDLIGLCMTNSEAIAVPTYGKRAMLGTNPIAFSMPADPVPFHFDAATTVVPRGKLEVYNKRGEPLPADWALDAAGQVTYDAAEVLHNIIHKVGGGIVPVGGAAELTGGHKGYGLGLLVEICTAILSGGPTSQHTHLNNGHSDTAHCFWAIDYGVFGDKAQIKQNLSTLLQELRESDKADGQTRIYTHGEKEMESQREKRQNGIPINEKTIGEMRDIGREYGMELDEYLF